MNAKPILAYDCAAMGASVALKQGEAVHTRNVEQARQASELIPAIDALMRDHNIAYADLGCIVTTIGPGSFTGVRIGLAALHGLVLANETPVKFISTLEALAWGIMEDTPPTRFTVTLRAGKGEVYAQHFEVKNATPLPKCEIFMAAETKADWAYPVYFDHFPSAAVMARIAQALPLCALADALPLYVRPPDAAIPDLYPWLQPQEWSTT